MLKLAGTVLVVAAFSCAGLMASQRMKERILILRQLSVMVDAIALRIRWEGASLNEIASELKDDPSLDRLSFLSDLADNASHSVHPIPFDVVWREAVSSWSSPPLTSSDMRMLNNMSDGLGTSDTDGQLSWQQRSRAELAYASEQAEEEYRRKAKLYRALGVISGAFAAVVLY